MATLKAPLYFINDLRDINNEIIPLKDLADRELASIYGLTGMVYTPHLDVYMQASIKRAEILACLKKQGILPITEVETITDALNFLHNRVKSNGVVEYKGSHYIRKFRPLKLSKSGKNVQKWAKFWLLQSPDGRIEPSWEQAVREIWPSFFLIRNIDL